MKYLETNVYIYCTKLLNKHFDIEQILNEIMYSKEQTMHWLRRFIDIIILKPVFISQILIFVEILIIIAIKMFIKVIRFVVC